MRHYTYIYFDENLVPYYVGEGFRKRFMVKHEGRGRVVPVPPLERILRFEQDCQEAAFAFESWLIKRIGRRDLGTVG
jgi:hypothetical protein